MDMLLNLPKEAADSESGCWKQGKVAVSCKYYISKRARGGENLAPVVFSSGNGYKILQTGGLCNQLLL